MSSRVIKIQVCDRCSGEERADVVAHLPAGWSRLIRSTGYPQKDLCPACTQNVLAAPDKWVTA